MAIIKGIKELNAGLLNQRKQRNATANTINVMAAMAQISTSRYIQSDYNHKASDVRIALTRASLTAPRAILSASAKRFPLMYFDAEVSATGVTATIKRGKPTNRKGAFIQTHRGKRRVFKRTSNLRYPIKRLTGPSIGQLMRGKENLSRINRMIRQRKDGIFMKEMAKIV